MVGCALNDHFICGYFIEEHSDLFVNITGFHGPFCLPICIRCTIFLPCGQNGLNQPTRMRRGRSNNKETPKGVPSSKNNRQLATTRPFRDSCIRSKVNFLPPRYIYLLGSVYPQGSKTLYSAYGPRSTSRVHRLYTCTSTRTRPSREREPVWPSGKALAW